MNINKTPAGRELDALVAERVMGWADINQGTRKWTGIPPGRRSDTFSLAQFVAVSHYSTDIAAAWIVTRKIKDLDLKHEYVVALVNIIFANVKGGVECTMNWLKATSDFAWLMIHATPEQRCQAALKAVVE